MWISQRKKSRKAVGIVSDHLMGFHLTHTNGVLSRRPQTFYLAYGSNLSIERMRGRCPDAEVIGRAMIPGYRMLFKKSQSGFYATIEQDANCTVPVLVYRISEYDEALLDRCEGYPRHYYKRYFQLSIRSLDGGKLKGKKNGCMAYVLHEDRPLGEPSMEYFDLLREGYNRWGFDDAILAKALSDSIGIRNAKCYLKEYTSLCWEIQEEKK